MKEKTCWCLIGVKTQVLRSREVILSDPMVKQCCKCQFKSVLLRPFQIKSLGLYLPPISHLSPALTERPKMSSPLLLLAMSGLASSLPVAQQQNCGNSQCNQNNFGGVFPAVGIPGAGFPIATGFPVVGAAQNCFQSSCNQNNGRKKREDNSAALAAHAAAEDAIRAKIGAPSLALVAHAAAEAAVRAQQAQGPGVVGPSGNIGASGIVGPSGNIGPSGLCGPSGCVAF